MSEQSSPAAPAPAGTAKTAPNPATDLAARMAASALIVIDPQDIFARPGSDWASPMWDAAWENIASLAQAFGSRAVITRWVPTADRNTSWGEYFKTWSFADVPEDHELYRLLPGAAALVEERGLEVISRPTFGKWGAELIDAVRKVHAPHLLLTGVSTDCCVISTALAAADAGVFVTVVSDACAGSTASNHAAALQVMSLYAPQISVVTTAEVLAALEA